jgi:hypothetical protein
LSNIPILGDIVGSLYDVVRLGTRAASGAMPVLSAAAPMLPLLLDKPESVDQTVRSFSTPVNDHWASDVASGAIPVKFSKRNYLAAQMNPAAKLGTWTLAQYASIPGIATQNVWSSLATDFTLPLVRSSTPLGYLMSRFAFWRGSIKIKLAFHCSSFYSSRFSLSVRPVGAGAGNFDVYVQRIFDVKGDTEIDVTIPFVCNSMWALSQSPPFQIHITRIGPIVTPDPAISPQIYMTSWMAAGPDFQFAVPNRDGSWGVNTSFPLSGPPPAVDVPNVELDPRSARPQSRIQEKFSKPFSPIVDGCAYALDNNKVVGDIPVTFDDIVKRYYPAPAGATPQTLYHFDTVPVLGAFVTCFLYRRGGYRVKFRDATPSENRQFRLQLLSPTLMPINQTSNAFSQTASGDNQYSTLSVPWCSPLPWTQKGGLSFLSLAPDMTVAPTIMFYAFSDDVELGYPCLPLGNLA